MFARVLALSLAASPSLACTVGDASRAPIDPGQCLAASRDLELVIDEVPGVGARLYLVGASIHDRTAQVLVDDRPVVDEAGLLRGPTGLQLPRLAVGAHTLVATVGEHQVTADFVVTAGQQTRVAIHVNRPSPAAPANMRPLPAGVLLRYHNRGCHGPCPSYRVTVFNDGRIHWYGRHHVRARGPRVARLSPQALASLRGWLACLAPLPRANDGWIHDLPRLLQFRVGDQQLEFEVTWGTRLIHRIVAEIERTLALARWIDPPR